MAKYQTHSPFLPLLARTLGVYGMFENVSRYAAFPNIPYTPSADDNNGINVAVSRDEGQTWKFLMAGPDDLLTLRHKFPICCEDLVLQKYWDRTLNIQRPTFNSQR